VHARERKGYSLNMFVQILALHTWVLICIGVQVWVLTCAQECKCMRKLVQLCSGVCVLTRIMYAGLLC